MSSKRPSRRLTALASEEAEIFKIRGKAFKPKNRSRSRRCLSYETPRFKTQSRRQTSPQASSAAGESSGHGKTSGKGHKGQKARSGGSIRPGFEGGQMPLYRPSPPKRGFTNAKDFKTVLRRGQSRRLWKSASKTAPPSTKSSFAEPVSFTVPSTASRCSGRGEVTKNSISKWTASAPPPRKRSKRLAAQSRSAASPEDRKADEVVLRLLPRTVPSLLGPA